MRRPASARRTGVLVAALTLAVCAPARAAEPFPVVEMHEAKRPSHRLAYATLLASAGLIAGSFSLGERANHLYDDYHQAIDPAEVDRLWNRTVHYDRLSSGAMIGGQALLVTGLWLRFLRHPGDSRWSASLGPSSCAVSLRF
jgi:hypothetical protein